MPLVQSNSKEAIAQNIRVEMKQGKKPRKQAIAIALDIARRNGGYKTKKEASYDPEIAMVKAAAVKVEPPKTGPEAILHALQNIDLAEVEKKAMEDLRSGKKTRRPGAVALLNIVRGMERNKITPADYMIKSVPVIPARYRPFAAQGGTLIPGDANVLYKDLFDVRDAHNEEREIFGDDNAGQSRLDLYDAVRSVYGYGEPVKAKTKAKEVKGFLQKLTGSTAKYSYFQRKLLSKTQDNVGRSTVVVDPELSIDEIGLPKEMAFTMYAPYIQRRLKLSGMRDADALKAVRDRSEPALRALQKEIEERPVVYSRAPAWHMHSILGGKVKLIDGDAIATNPFVTTGLGMDYDGDTVNVHVPASDDAVKEAFEKLMPSTTPFSNREEGKIVPLPKQEQILGLYTAATAPATQSFTFDTENEAIDAIRRGKVPLSADVQIRQGVKSASATQNEEMKASIEKESGPVRDPRTGKWLPTQRGDKGEIVKQASSDDEEKTVAVTLRGIKQEGDTRVRQNFMSARMVDTDVVREAITAAQDGTDKKKIIKLVRDNSNFPDDIVVSDFNTISVANS